MIKTAIINKLPSGQYRLYSRKKDKSGKRKNLGTFDSLKAAKERERQVQFFKHHADDGQSEDEQDKILKKLSDIAIYLEESGFVDSANKVYNTMNAIDGFSIPNYEEEPIEKGMYNGNITKSPSFGSDIGILSKLQNIANYLDKKGNYEEADHIDELMNKIVKKLEKGKIKKQENQTADEDAAARLNGKDNISVIDNQNAGMFSGLSDYFFYRRPGSVEDNF